MKRHHSHIRTLASLGLAVLLAFSAESATRHLQAQNRKVIHSGGIINVANNKGLDVREQSREDGANIQIWEYTGAANQIWNIVEVREGVVAIVSRMSGKALDVQDKEVKDGANVQQYRLADAANQLWRLVKGSRGTQIIGLASGKCLDVDANKIRENGANVQVWKCSDQANQAWRLSK